MIIQMHDAVMTDLRIGKSKAGNDYGVITFFFDYEQYKVFVMGQQLDVAKKLPVRLAMDMLFELRPDDRNGGVRLNLLSATDANGEYYGSEV